MLNSTILIKAKERLNKLDSQDYDNIECWQIVEAFNKGQVEWCRRQLVGTNLLKQGDEQSRRRVDDLQILLVTAPAVISNKKTYYEFALAADYFQYKRISAKASTPACTAGRPLVIYQAEEVNVPLLLRDENKKPSFDWGETFSTLVGNTARIYTNGDFTLNSAEMMYYRQPILIQVDGCVNPYTNLVSTVNVESEFKDDIVELLIDEAVKILAGDIESINQKQISEQNAEKNN